MKIVHVETGCHLYGGALQVQYLMQGLAALGHENVLLCDQRSPLAKAAAGAARVHACEVSGDLDLRLAARLWRLLRREQPDLLHLHSRRGADVMGGIAGRAAGVPVLLSRRVDNREPRGLVPIKYALYDHVIAISQGIVTALQADGVAPQRISCVPSAVDTDVYRPQRNRDWFEHAFGIAPTEPVIGMVAQLIPRKGHRHLLAALPALWARHPAVHVLLLGKGPLEPELRAEIADRGWQQRVHLAGFRDDLPRLLPCLDVLTHPADMEGLGVSLLQAAGCGVPIVASAVGGIPEVVQGNGYLVPRADPAALASALADLLDDPQAATRMGTRGRQWVQRRFSVSAMVAGNVAVYERLLGGRTALPRPDLAVAD